MNATNPSSGQVLVLEPDEQLASTILQALHETSPGAAIDLAGTLEEAQGLALRSKPDLFVLDVDTIPDLGQEFLYDLRTSHPNSRAIILTAAHLAAAREQTAAIGAIHFLEKPFPHNDFVDLVQALLRPSAKPEGEKFQGTLSDLHVADIIQLKCMSGATAAIEFTSPSDEKGRVYFDHGQVRHATAGNKQGMAAFNEIVTWKGGRISEVAAEAAPQSITLDWQILLMEAMRKVDEDGAVTGAKQARAKSSTRRKILVIDDSLMLLNFVKEILTEANYDVTTATNAQESLTSAKASPPELILLDYVLPDMKGDEVTRRLKEDATTTAIPVIYMSGLGTDLRSDAAGSPNVIGFLNKPFTSDLLIKTVEEHMPESPDRPGQPESPSFDLPPAAETTAEAAPIDFSFHDESPFAGREPAQPVVPQEEEWWSAPPGQETWGQAPASSTQPFTPEPSGGDLLPLAAATAAAGPAFRAQDTAAAPDETVTSGIYFCGDTNFFSLNWALQTLAKAKLTGMLRCFWGREPVDLLTKNGEIVLATTRDPELYCSEAPITLVNVDQEKINQARAQQRETGCPLFITLAQGGAILQEPSVQLVQHYGQKLFAHLWTAPSVRFMFEKSANVPPWAAGVTPDGDVDQWGLATLRLTQFADLGTRVNYDPGCIPAYTRDGFERVQDMRLTVAEAQFASQFNGVRSIQQISKNLRLDLKFARLTLFRFLALEIVECWPATSAAKPEPKGVLQRITRSFGIGD
ncbi:MAG TPA: response regulator [Chthoniobacterales bacterium]